MDPIIEGNLLKNFKIIFIGSSKVGKSSIINKYINHNFIDNYFPTKDFISYKSRFNFNPHPEEIDEYIYVETIDTMGIDIARNLNGYYDFFNQYLLNENQVSTINPKFPKEIKIKNEFISEKQDYKGLFGINRIMCYCYVFDLNEKSFNEVVSVASMIHNAESNRVFEEKNKSVKVFVCNKFDEGIEGEKYFNDSKFDEILNKLKKFYLTEEELKENFFVTSAKFNLNIENLFVSILRKINQRDFLWKNVDYESTKENITDQTIKEEARLSSDEDEEEDKKPQKIGFFEKLFCCFPQKKEKKTTKILNGGGFNEDEFDSNYDKNEYYEINK